MINISQRVEKIPRSCLFSFLFSLNYRAFFRLYLPYIEFIKIIPLETIVSKPLIYEGVFFFIFKIFLVETNKPVKGKRLRGKQTKQNKGYGARLEISLWRRAKSWEHSGTFVHPLLLYPEQEKRHWYKTGKKSVDSFWWEKKGESKNFTIKAGFFLGG